MGITQIVNENAVKCKKTVFNPSHVPNSTKICVKSWKNSPRRPGAIHELEMLVAILICVAYIPSRPAIDSQAFKDRPVDRDGLVGLLWSSSYELELAVKQKRQVLFLVEFLNGFELYLPDEAAIGPITFSSVKKCRARKNLNVALQISESPYVCNLVK